MPKYKVTAPDGRTVYLTGDSAPTDADLEEVFAGLPQKTGMTADTQENFDQANETLKNMGYWLNRGENAGGVMRNIAMGVIPGTAEAEAALRATKQAIRNIDPSVSEEKKTDETWGESYDKYLQNARESREEFARKNPTEALGLRIGGGVAGTLIPFSKAAKAANWGQAVARSVPTGAGVGAAFGFGNAQGGLENRLESAALGATYGAGAGLLGPSVATTLGATKNVISRASRGWGKDLPQQEIESFMLSKTLQPTTESRRLASTLGYGSAAGAQDIENAAFDLLKLQKTMNTKIKPASYSGKTAGGTTAKDFLQATQVPSLTEAKKAFGEFVENVPTVEKPTRPAQAILEKLENNKTALRILDDNADQFLIATESGAMKPMDPGTFEYWQKIQQILSNKLPKKYTPSRLTGAKKEIYDAIQEISKVREKLFKGTKAINNQYSDAVADQAFADSQLSERLQTMSRQKEPQSLPGGAVPTLGWLFKPAQQRGLARELIQTGEISPVVRGPGYQSADSILESILKSGLNLQ